MAVARLVSSSVGNLPTTVAGPALGVVPGQGEADAVAHLAGADGARWTSTTVPSSVAPTGTEDGGEPLGRDVVGAGDERDLVHGLPQSVVLDGAAAGDDGDDQLGDDGLVRGVVPVDLVARHRVEVGDDDEGGVAVGEAGVGADDVGADLLDLGRQEAKGRHDLVHLLFRCAFGVGVRHDVAQSHRSPSWCGRRTVACARDPVRTLARRRARRARRRRRARGPRLPGRRGAGHGGVPGARACGGRCCSRARPAWARPRWPRCCRRWTGGELLRLQCYEGIDVSQAVYEWDYARQLLHLRAAEAAGVAGGASVDQLEDELYDERFLVRRPLLEAVDPARGTAAGAADRRGRPRRRRVRGVPARGALRLLGHRPRARHVPRRRAARSS